MQRKYLTTDEEQNIVAAVQKLLPDKPQYLGVLIRLCTGARASEICELTWRDFIEIGDSGRYKLCFINNPSSARYRCVPTILPVQNMLLSSKPSQASQTDFILTDSVQPNKQLCVEDFKQMCFDLISGVNKNFDLATLNDSQNEGLFQSTFRQRAFEYCGLLFPEVNYLTGAMESQDLLWHRLCDFNSDQSQMTMLNDLDHWPTAKWTCTERKGQIVSIHTLNSHTVIAAE